MKTILVTGATGLIGRNLVAELCKQGYGVIALTTDSVRVRSILKDIKIVEWNNRLDIQNERIHGIIHLAGMNLAARRWNKKVKLELISSRTETAKKLVNLISLMKEKPEVIISASGVDYYDDCGEVSVDEDSPPGKGFISELVIEWEKSVYNAEDYGVRVVVLRSGFVLAKDSPAIKRMIIPFKFYAGGYPGNGKQFFSWIHIDDLVRIYIKALDDRNMSGAYNAVAPSYNTMRHFCKELGNVLSKPSLLPVPKIFLRILYGEIADMITSGRKVIPKRLNEIRFDFKYENVGEALRTVTN